MAAEDRIEHWRRLAGEEDSPAARALAEACAELEATRRELYATAVAACGQTAT